MAVGSPPTWPTQQAPTAKADGGRRPTAAWSGGWLTVGDVPPNGGRSYRHIKWQLDRACIWAASLAASGCPPSFSSFPARWPSSLSIRYVSNTFLVYLVRSSGTYRQGRWRKAANRRLMGSWLTVGDLPPNSGRSTATSTDGWTAPIYGPQALPPVAAPLPSPSLLFLLGDLLQCPSGMSLMLSSYI
jgi:hypothetical protein